MAPNTRPRSKRVCCEEFEQPQQLSNLSSRDKCQRGLSSIHAKSVRTEVALLQRNETIEQPNLHSNLNSRHNNHCGTSSIQIQENILQHNTSCNRTTCDVTDDLLEDEIVRINEDDNTNEIVVNKKKKVRGATCMPKVWGQQPNELVVVSFNDLGQPNDQDKTSTLSHFLGTIARNGRYCPLNYEDWRLMPYSYKQEMLRIVKARFQLPPGHETYILKSINKKWRNWKSFVKNLSIDPDIPIEQQKIEIPERVNEDQFKSLVQYWMSEKSKKQSEKNKDTRGQLDLLHHMGKKSFAVVKEKLRERYGRHPTRAELFEECYYRDGSSKSDKIKEAIVKMKELVSHDSQNSNGNQGTYNPDDSFAKVMGKDKNGQLRMYGLGVTPIDVYGEKPSRAALLRQAMEYKTKFMEAVEKYETLNAKIDNLSAHVHGTQSTRQTDGQSPPLTSPNQVGLENAPLTSSNGQDGSAYHPLVFTGEQVDAQSPTFQNNQRSLGSTTSRAMQIKVGSYVVLKSLGSIDEIVATGVVDEMDNVSVNGTNLDTDFCLVVVQHMVKKEARLIFSYKHIQTIGNALGVPIAWPLSLVTLDDEFHF